MFRYIKSIIKNFMRIVEVETYGYTRCDMCRKWKKNCGSDGGDYNICDQCYNYKIRKREKI
jgi:hypothetical protein